MKHVLFSLFLIISSATHAMESEIDNNNLQNIAFTDQHKQTIRKIIKEEKEIPAICCAINTLAKYNLAWQFILLDKQNAGLVINQICNCYNDKSIRKIIEKEQVALAIGSFGALAWAQEYVQQEPKARKRLNCFLTQLSCSEIVDGSLQLAKNILFIGTSSDAKNEALINAASKNSPEFIQLLLEHDTKSELNLQIPFTQAASLGYNHILTMLIAHNANVNATDEYGNTALHLATQYQKNIEIVKLLLTNGVNVNTADKHGNTVLHLAVKVKNIEKIQLFLNHGISINHKNAVGKTALGIALQMNSQHGEQNDKYPAIINLLKNAGATE
jgi:Ankyrin repeats (3 copies)